VPESASKAAAVEIGLGLGSNIGDKPGNIRRALQLLEERNVARLAAVSSIYRTKPWGYVNQEDFANACALAQTTLDPLALLAAVKQVETDMGREPELRWGPRLIDIDLLFYGDTELALPELTLPHKEIFNRAFVLVPLIEIAPDLRLGGRSIKEAGVELAEGDVAKWENGQP
jgi:2-amino-4-hydroxy-6-hydroxymethyldihydropteridine diphosphokinase